MYGGTCLVAERDGAVDYTCSCRLGFSGPLCLTPQDHACLTNPCRNGGTCDLLTLNDYNCHCSPGWSGEPLPQTLGAPTYVSAQCSPCAVPTGLGDWHQSEGLERGELAAPLLTLCRAMPISHSCTHGAALEAPPFSSLALGPQGKHVSRRTHVLLTPVPMAAAACPSRLRISAAAQPASMGPRVART